MYYFRIFNLFWRFYYYANYLTSDITSAIYIQISIIAAVAYINGDDLNSDETQTFVYVYLASVCMKKVLI